MTPGTQRSLSASVAGLLLAFAPSAQAGLPDWARRIAETAPAFEEAYEKPTRVLLDEVRFTIGKNGESSMRWRSATQILGSQVDRIRTQEFPFQEDSSLRCRGWHLPAGDRAQKAHRDPVELPVGDEFLNDLRARFVTIRGVSRGSLVFLESVMVKERPVTLAMTHQFGGYTETLLERFEVEVPPGWEMRSAWLRRPGPAPVIQENLWRWELEGLAAYESEPIGVPGGHEAPLLLVSLVPPSHVRVAPQVFSDWPKVSMWWEGVVKGRDAVTPEIEASTKKTLAAAPEGFFDRVRILGRYVRDNVRYVAKEVGIENYQPRPAPQVLAQLHGDCKDKATLLRAMLKATGIDSYYLHVNATTPDTFSADVPTWAWNHAIVAVSIPSATQAPKSFDPAIVEGGDLGRLLVVDPTDPYAAIGNLPSNLLGKTTLVSAGTRSRLLVLPKGEPTQNKIERKFNTRIQADESLDIETTWRYTGTAAAWARGEHAGSHSDRRRAAEDQLLKVFVHGKPKSYSVEPEDSNGAYTETMHWHVPPRDGGLREVPLFIGAADSLPRTSVGSKRKTPVDYEYPVTLLYETRVEGAPATAVLPPPGQRQGQDWSVTTSCAREGDAILARWEMVLSKPRFEVSVFGELKKLWRSIEATGGASIALNPQAPP